MSAPDMHAAELPHEAEEASPERPDVGAAIARLAAMPFADFAACRAEEAAALSMTRRDLDKAVKAARAKATAEGEATRRAGPPPSPGEVRWPGWVRQRPDGLYADAGEDAPPLWLAAPFEVMGEARGADGTGWGLWLRWRDREGRLKAWLMPKRALMVGQGELEATLADLGLNVSGDFAAHRHLRRALAEVRAGTLVLAVSRAGWHAAAGGPAAYVLPSGETIGETGEQLVLRDAGEEAAARCATAGTLAGWQGEVAAKAVGNPLAAFAMSCAFAGTLLMPAGEGSGGMHLAGGSKAGKTTACQMGATAWGPPHKGATLRDWNSTANALEAVAEEAGDGLLILDEIHQADPRAVTGAVYALAGEGGKSRLTRDASARKRRTWRTFILSNGEIDLATVAAKAGQRLPAGAAVRLPSIPVERSGAAWPKLHGAADFAAFMADLHGAMKRHHGHAVPAFLAKLAAEYAADPEEIRAVVQSRRERFAKGLPADADAQARDVARRFALVAAAGELATVWGVLPWPEGEATRAAETMLGAWLTTRGGAGAAEDAEALERVRRFIAEHGEARFPALGADGEAKDESGRVTLRRAGFRKAVGASPDGGGKVPAYLFFPEVWTAEVFEGANATAGARALQRAGFLVTREIGRAQRKERVPGFEKPVWFYAVRAAIMEADGELKPEAPRAAA
jgi:putative DNA primase/helicase